MRFTQPVLWMAAITMAFLSGCSTSPPYTSSAPSPTPTQQAANEKMLQSAQKAYQAVSVMEARVPGRPDYIDMQIEWSRHILAAQLSLCTINEERRKALEDHLEQAKARVDRIRKMPRNVASDLVIAQAEYALAEAEYLQAKEK